ncbi:twin-arginine translocation signal domain-containing protein, partial [Pantoea piersonii]
MSFSRRQFIQLSAGAALSAGLLPSAARAPPPPP